MKVRNSLMIMVVVFVLSLGSSFTRTIAEGSAQTLDLPKGDAYLSPDGLHIFLVGTGAKSLCVYSAAGQQEICGQSPTVPDLNSVRWSPDSRSIAFTENFFMNFREPDIWVMDAQTGQITNLTEDQITKVNIGDMASLPSIDVIPTWTADSKQVLFIRYHGTNKPDPAQQHKEKADLYQVPREGGQAVQVGTLTFPPNTPPLPTYALALDGKQIAYNVDTAKREGEANGLWVADLDGKNARQVLKVYGMVNAAFSADGRFILGLNGFILGQFSSTWDQSSSLVASLDGGKEDAIDPEHAAQWAAWSPAGAALAYIVHSPKQPAQDGLYVAEEPGKAGKQVYAGSLIPPAPSARWQGLSWAANNTLLAQTPDRKVVLIHLDAKQSGQ